MAAVGGCRWVFGIASGHVGKVGAALQFGAGLHQALLGALAIGGAGSLPQAYQDVAGVHLLQHPLIGLMRHARVFGRVAQIGLGQVVVVVGRLAQVRRGGVEPLGHGLVHFELVVHKEVEILAARELLGRHGVVFLIDVVELFERVGAAADAHQRRLGGLSSGGGGHGQRAEQSDCVFHIFQSV